MKSGRRYILTFIVGLVFTVSVRADMMPVSQENSLSRQSPGSCAGAECQSETLPVIPELGGIAGMNLWSVELLLQADPRIEPAPEMQQIRRLTDGSNSLRLCLSALISLGLCCSAQWVKRLSLGFVPEWYHEGGPFQIGHSHALMPGTLAPAQTCCFVQPFETEDDNLPRYFIKIAMSHWRKSQFTPNVLASRGPPAAISTEGI